MIYGKLIDVGCTHSTACRLKQSLASLSDNTLDAFIIWASGHSIRGASKLCGIDDKTLRNAIAKVKSAFNT